VVYQDADGGPKKVNHLFKADYFGEQALLTSAPRCATGGYFAADVLA
jgi:CRP-like cAMP-binding protein